MANVRQGHLPPQCNDRTELNRERNHGLRQGTCRCSAWVNSPGKPEPGSARKERGLAVESSQARPHTRPRGPKVEAHGQEPPRALMATAASTAALGLCPLSPLLLAARRRRAPARGGTHAARPVPGSVAWVRCVAPPAPHGPRRGLADSAGLQRCRTNARRSVSAWARSAGARLPSALDALASRTPERASGRSMSP